MLNQLKIKLRKSIPMCDLKFAVKYFNKSLQMSVTQQVSSVCYKRMGPKMLLFQSLSKEQIQWSPFFCCFYRKVEGTGVCCAFFRILIKSRSYAYPFISSLAPSHGIVLVGEGGKVGRQTFITGSSTAHLPSFHCFCGKSQIETCSPVLRMSVQKLVPLSSIVLTFK